MQQCGHRPSASWQQHPQWLATVCYLVFSCIISVSMQQIVPEEEPVYYYVGCFTARTDLLKESVYAKTPQTCIEICEHQGHRYAVLAAEKCFCANQLEENERQDEILCHTRCIANKAQYCGGVGVHSYYSTTLLRQPGPHRLRVTNKTANSLTLHWDAYEPSKLLLAGGVPGPQIQLIANYLIKCQVIKTYSTLPTFQQPEFLVQGTETSFELTDLQPATLYNVSVRAICAAQQQQQEEPQQQQNDCGSAAIMDSTDVGLPSPAPAHPKILSRTEQTITIELAPVQNNNGPVTKLLIIVERVDNSLSQPFDAQLLGSWQESQLNGVPYYIAAELDYDRPEDTRHFVVGDDKRYGRYRNVPLQTPEGDEDNKEAHVHISLGVVSTLRNITKTLYTRSTHEQHASSLDDFSYATFEKGQSSVVALAVTCVIFGSCLLLSLISYFYLRFKTHHSRGGGRARNAHEMTQQTPIIERENNGYLMEEELPPSLENLRQQMQTMMNALNQLPRGALRYNTDEVIGDGHYGKIITGRLHASEAALHVLSLDELSGASQVMLLRELGNLRKLQRHELLVEFYGISMGADCSYLVFELQRVSLKRRLIESRLATPAPRLSTLTEQLVLQWMYELSSAMSYLVSCHVQHRQLSSYSVYVTADSRIKVSVFGPLHYANSNRQQLDLSRWLAPEVLRHQHQQQHHHQASHVTAKSDVWSFACVAWECCALGGTPYANVASSQQLLEALRAGVRPAQPAYVYGDLYQLLLNCWQLEPSERIGFEDVAFGVRQLMTSARHALCFDRSPGDTFETLPLYLPMLETRP